MLPDIPDNDTDAFCWATNCQEPSGRSPTGLCSAHVDKLHNWLAADKPINGYVYGVLGMRLNVYEESGGACVKASSPCDLKSCRYHLDDGADARRVTGDDTCAIRLGERGPLILEDIAQRMGCTRERIRQVEVNALRSLRRACERAGIRLRDVLGRIAA